MKTTNKATNKTTNTPSADNLVPGGTSVFFAPSVEQITNDFLIEQAKKAKKQGGNDCLQDVSLSLKMLIQNYRDRSWNANDCLQLCQHMNLSAEEILPIFFLWCDELKKHKRIRQTLSVSSFPSYCFQ